MSVTFFVFCHLKKQKQKQKTNEITPFVAIWMGIEIDILSGVVRQEVSYDIPYQYSSVQLLSCV